MASSSSSCIRLIGILIVVAAVSIQCASAATYTVGDTTGWTIPSGGAQFYTTWTSGKRFAVGDTLIFNFNAQAHDVAQVTKTEYDACTGTNPIGGLKTTSPANIVLNATGSSYFICTFPGHCSAGQKLTVDVGETSAATPTSSPPSTTTTPTASSGGPTPSPTAGGNTPNAATSHLAGYGVVGVAVSFLAFFL